MSTPEQYGDPAAEERACRETVGVIDRSDRGSLLLSGDRAGEMLQRLVSSDVKGLAEGAEQPSCLLTGKGKLVAAFWLRREGPGTFRLRFDEPLREEVAAAFRKYGVLDDVTATADSSRERTALLGPRAAELLSRIDAAPAAVRRIEENELEIDGPALGLRQRLEERALALGGGPAGQAAAEVLRVERGAPRWGVDFDGGHFPNECGWEDALSYSKGCYIGQETIARMKTYGHLNRRLMRLRCAVREIEVLPGAKLFSAGVEAGQITSAARSLVTGEHFALGYVRSRVWEPGTLLALGAADGPEVRVLALRPG